MMYIMFLTPSGNHGVHGRNRRMTFDSNESTSAGRKLTSSPPYERGQVH